MCTYNGCVFFLQLARRCERVLINKYLDVFYSEFVTLLHDDREEGKSFKVTVGGLADLVILT